MDGPLSWNVIFESNLKVPLSGLRQFLTTGSPFKMMKNDFYFMLKAFFVLELFYIFYPDFLVIKKNGLIRKLWLISKFMA